jgi:hypothetical protein
LEGEECGDAVVEDVVDIACGLGVYVSFWPAVDGDGVIFELQACGFGV